MFRNQLWAMTCIFVLEIRGSRSLSVKHGFHGDWLKELQGSSRNRKKIRKYLVRHGKNHSNSPIDIENEFGNSSSPACNGLTDRMFDAWNHERTFHFRSERCMNYRQRLSEKKPEGMAVCLRRKHIIAA